MRLLSAEEMNRLLPAETHAFRGPVPTQIVSSEEYFPTPQTAAQREVEARLKTLGDELGARQGSPAAHSCAPRPAWRRPTWP
jgi:hypothetical protein